MKSRKGKRLKKNKNILLKGNITIYILISVIIVTSIFLTRGLFPQNKLTTPENNGEAIIINEPIPTGEKNLQLRTLKFKTCTDTVAVDLLIDTSGSMQRYGNKMEELKKALNTFTSKLSDNSVIAMHTFSYSPPREIVPFSYYKDVKRSIPSTISSLYGDGPTYMRDAFSLVKEKLDQAQKDFPPKYKFVLIFLSDGVPETYSCGRQTDPPLPTCSAEDQNPLIPPNIAQQIKGTQVKIYSIAILDEQDSRFNDKLQTLLKDVASPNSYYVAPNARELTRIYKEISNKLCD